MRPIPPDRLEAWKPFYFDGNLAWGRIDNREAWNRVVEAYRTKDMNRDVMWILEARSRGNDDHFGFVIECKGPKTLREFFEENGMEIQPPAQEVEG